MVPKRSDMVLVFDDIRDIKGMVNSLTITQLERQGADIQSKVEHLNQAMRDRDKLKDDAIADLSDQLIALTARLDSIPKAD